jgi:tRNA threonylcarbamoyladenosine biosynthesis protein TsaB
MALILSIETSTSVCSVSLHERGELLVDREVHTPQAAAAQLSPMIESLFVDNGLKKSDLRAIAVSAGPGSYTGLRIGLSTAKGICYALDIPLLVLDSLHVLAQSIGSKIDTGLLCPMIDARRMEVYTCLLTPAMVVVEPSRPLVIDEQSFAGILASTPVTFFGNGAEKCKSVIRHPHAEFVPGVYPRARAMGNLAFRKFENATFADVRQFEPAYLKEFVAKTKGAESGL